MSKDFELGIFRPEDAEGLVKLFRAVYGEHYPIKLFYDPQEIIKANSDGRYYSIIARSNSGQVLGTMNLYRSAPYSSLYEIGALLVLQEYRNLGITKEMTNYVYEEFVPQQPDIEEVFAEVVCNHPISQKAFLKHNSIESAIEIALMPAEAYAQEKSAPGRVAVLSFFRCYKPKPHKIFLPDSYDDILREIYWRLDDTREIVLSETKIPAGSISQVKMDLFEFAQVARITIQEIGSDFKDCLKKTEDEAIDKKTMVLQVWLDLTTPWVGEAVKELRNRGYFFGGALPRWFDGDGLLMQKLMCPPYFDSIQLHSDFSRHLLEVVKEDWQKINFRHITD